MFLLLNEFSQITLLGRERCGDADMNDALGEEGKDALCKACWDLRPNGETLIAGKRSSSQAVVKYMLEPVFQAHHAHTPLPSHTVFMHKISHTHKHIHMLSLSV